MENVKKQRILYIRFVLFCVLFFVINSILSLIAYAPTEYHRLQNHDLYSGKKYDVIAFGSSDCRVNFDPAVASEVLGTSCFNYGGSATTYYSGGIMASFENAMLAQSPSKVLFFVAYNHFTVPEDEMKNESDKIFIHSTLEMKNKLAKVKYWYKASKYTGALERLCPFFALKDEEDYKYNIEKKKELPYWKYDVDWRNELNQKKPYMGDGFVPYIEGGMEEISKTPSIEDIDINKYKDAYGYELESLLEKCKKKNIETYVIMQPRQVKAMTYNYYLASKRVEEISNMYDAVFVDANMIDKDVMRLPEEYWNSATHLGYEGAKIYTDILCKAIIDKESVDFYPDFESFVESFE